MDALPALNHQLVSALTRPDQERLRLLKEKLIKDNAALGGSPNGFLYSGRYYSSATKALPGIKKPIHPSLYGTAEELRTETKNVQAEQIRLAQGLVLVLRHCHTTQDQRDALPDECVSLVPQLTALPRTRPEAYPILGKELLLHQWGKTKELITFFLAGQFIY